MRLREVNKEAFPRAHRAASAGVLLRAFLQSSPGESANGRELSGYLPLAAAVSQDLNRHRASGHEGSRYRCAGNSGLSRRVLKAKRGNSLSERATFGWLRFDHSFVWLRCEIQIAWAWRPASKAIPVKRQDKKLVGYLTRDEINAILCIPDKTRWSGRRDRALILTMYNSGARVSEPTSLQRSQVHFGESTFLQLNGKGRKERTVPLWPLTSKGPSGRPRRSP
jgi:integrase